MLTLSLSFHLSNKKRLQTKALHAKSIVIPFDYKALKRVLGDRVPDLFHALDLAPDEAFQALACAAHECLFYSLPKEERGRLIASGFKEKAFEGVVLANGENDEMISRRNNRNVIGKECKVTCHVYNFSSKFKVRDFRELKSSWLGRVVQLKGVVQKADATKPLCKSIFFKCEQCKESILVTLDKSGNFKAPANCETPKCRGK
jgi:DNA replicative helicase MCM subunit Mcm2 (Cdc46/Mcm family)